jgi:plastocyanin
LNVRRLLIAAATSAPLLLVSAPRAVAVGPPVSISVVDAPRVQERWGYAPATRTIAPGTWVTWSNAGQESHTVTAVDGSFDSGNLDPSDGFSWYFDQPGSFEYTCSLHPWMVGRIVVAAQDQAEDQSSDDADS